MKRLSAVTVALISFTVMACISADDPNRRAKKGATIGAATGAVAGAVIGNQQGDPQKGAVIGGAVGAGIGALIGHQMDKQQEELRQIEGVEVTRTAEDELNVVIRNDVLFDVNSAGLRSQSRSTLSDMSAVFVRYPDTTIAVEGHADSTGTTYHNQDLSERRAESVRDYLRGQGVTGSRINARGYGEMRPKTSNDTPEGRQMNRRVEIHVKANPPSSN